MVGNFQSLTFTQFLTFLDRITQKPSILRKVKKYLRPKRSFSEKEIVNYTTNENSRYNVFKSGIQTTIASDLDHGNTSFTVTNCLD